LSVAYASAARASGPCPARAADALPALAVPPRSRRRGPAATSSKDALAAHLPSSRLTLMAHQMGLDSGLRSRPRPLSLSSPRRLLYRPRTRRLWPRQMTTTAQCAASAGAAARSAISRARRRCPLHHLPARTVPGRPALPCSVPAFGSLGSYHTADDSLVRLTPSEGVPGAHLREVATTRPLPSVWFSTPIVIPPVSWRDAAPRA
jgi:hypothetical protein